MKFYIKHPNKRFALKPFVCYSNRRPDTDIYSPHGGFNNKDDAMEMLKHILNNNDSPIESIRPIKFVNPKKGDINGKFTEADLDS